MRMGDQVVKKYCKFRDMEVFVRQEIYGSLGNPEGFPPVDVKCLSEDKECPTDCRFRSKLKEGGMKEGGKDPFTNPI